MVLDAKLVNMLVAYGKVVDFGEDPKKVEKMSVPQVMGWMDTLDIAEQKIAERLFQLWRAQYPKKFFILPAMRPAKDFE